MLSFIRFATLLHHCLGSIRKGSKKASAKEIALASHAIGKILINMLVFHIVFIHSNINFKSFVGLLALTVGCGDKAREIFKESIDFLDESLASGLDASKISVSRIFKIMLGLVLNFSLLILEGSDAKFSLLNMHLIVGGVLGHHHFCWWE